MERNKSISATTHEVIKLLYAYSQQNNTTSLTFSKLVVLAQGYAQKFYKERNALISLTKNTEENLLNIIGEMEEDNQIQIIRDNQGVPQSLRYVGYFKTAVTHWYKKMETDPSLPFFSNHNLHPPAPSQEYILVPIDKDFTSQWESLIENPKILQLSFQENLPEILITSQILETQLLLFCIEKIGRYIYLNQLFTEINSRLKISDPEISNIRLILDSFTSDPTSEQKRIREGHERSVNIWSVIYGVMMKNMDSVDLSDLSEQYAFQSVIILHRLLTYFSEKRKQEEKREALTQMILEKISHPPYLFTLTGILDLISKSEKGTLLPPDEIRELVEKLLESPRTTAKVIKVDTPEKQYYITTAHIITFLGTELQNISNAYRKYYRNHWVQSVTEGKRYPFFQDEEALEQHLENKLQKEFPQVYMMMNWQVIEEGLRDFEQQDENVSLYETVNNVLSTNGTTLISYQEIFRLTFERIKKEASLLLPLWSLIPIINTVIRFLISFWKNLTTRRKHRAEERKLSPQLPSLSAATPRVSPEVQRVRREKSPSSSNSPDITTTTLAPRSSHSPSLTNEKVQELITQIGSLKEGQTRLQHLVGQWNYLIDPKEREALVEDVNTLCRDVLRKIWNGHISTIPTGDRLENLAERVVSTRTFKNINNQHSFHDYIVLYLSLTILQRLNKI